MINCRLNLDNEATILHIRCHYIKLVGVWYKVVQEHTKFWHAIQNCQTINTKQMRITYARFSLQVNSIITYVSEGKPYLDKVQEGGYYNLIVTGRAKKLNNL
jgi:hypothetical protein